MNDIKIIIDAAIKLLKYPINLYGYEISFWNVLIFGLIASLFLYVIYRLMG